MDIGQTVKTPKQLAHSKVVKYRDTASLNLGGKVLEWWKIEMSSNRVSPPCKPCQKDHCRTCLNVRFFSTTRVPQ